MDEIKDKSFILDDNNILKKNRLEKLENIKNMGINPYPTKFIRTDNLKNIKTRFSNYSSEEPSEELIKVSGRIVSIRKMGKAAFINIKDWYDKIQVYIRKDFLGDENFNLFKEIDLSDIIGIDGNIFKTKTGELTVLAKKLTLLSKSLRALPIVKEKENVDGEKIKFDDVSDLEFKYRQRYVDLNIDDHSREVFEKRSKIINFIRNYLTNLNFLEVETPIMQTLSGGAAARPFSTYHNALNMPLYLRIAPELYLKRLIAGGMDRVFEIGRNFRNEGISTRHNPEFTMLELYQSLADYYDMMDLAENMVKETLSYINDGNLKIKYGNYDLDFGKKWNRIKMEDLFKKYAGFGFEYLDDLAGMRNMADKLNIKYENNATIQKIYDQILEDKIEPYLIEPTIVYDFPKAWSPLSKEKFDNPTIAERFEIYIVSRELGNAYSELNNPLEQRKRMEEQAEMKLKGDDEACDVDYDYIRALEYGLSPCGGLGIGIDRLVMLLTNSQSIRDVIFFPHMKPEI